MELDGLGGSLLAAAQDVLEAVLQEVDAAALRQLKAASVAWCAHARRELCNRLWVRLSRRAGQPEPAGVDSITDLDVECLNEAGRPWEAVVAGRQLPQLARLHGYGFVVDVQAVREADLGAEEEDDNDDEEDEDAPLGGVTLRSCIQGEGDPPEELLLAAVACAAPGTVRGVPVQRLREDDAVDESDLIGDSGIGVTGATLLGLMLPAATTLCRLDIGNLHNSIGDEGATKLAAVLKETKITNLILWGNGIGDEGASALAAILKETQITNLNLAENRLGSEGGVALAEGLKGNTTLQSLNLERNDIGHEAGAALAAGLKGNSTLQVLRLGYNEFRAKGAAALAAVLKETQITELNIWGNKIGDKGASALAAVLKETRIIQLDLWSNDISDQAKQAVRDAAGNGVSILF